MALRLEGYIDLPEHTGPGGFDHAAVHRGLRRLYVAHTANNALDVIDLDHRHCVGSIAGLTGVAGALVDEAAYLDLVVATVGAVIMPWMLFYQQAATVDKGLGLDDLPAARAETLVGAVASELLMAAVVVAAAAAMAGPAVGIGASVGALPLGLARLASGFPAVLIAAGMIGSGLLAAVVISLSSAWAWSELFRWPHSLNLSLRRAPGFYALYLLEVVPAALVALLALGLWSALGTFGILR